MDRDLTTLLSQRGLTLTDLRNNPTLLESIADDLGKRNAASRDNHEIFTALFTVVDFFPEGSLVGFPMKQSFSPEKNTIMNIDDLLASKEINSLNDFLIHTKDEIYSFQLKRYRGKPDTQELLVFLRETISGYYGQLGDTNLLVILQPESNDLAAIDFDSLHTGLRGTKDLGNGTVLITYNANGERNVIQQVHPERAISARDSQPPSQKSGH